MSRDRRAEPLVGDRVPYVIVYGTPGLPLIQLVRSPHDLLLHAGTDSSLRLNAAYYINKHVLPTVHRLLSLLGVDALAWYSQLPRLSRCARSLPPTSTKR